MLHSSSGVGERRIEIIRNLRKDCILLKLDKEQGIVVLKREQYITSVQAISDITKFKRISSDPTLICLRLSQNFINKGH